MKEDEGEAATIVIPAKAGIQLHLAMAVPISAICLDFS
jgi:hypothetical protein